MRHMYIMRRLLISIIFLASLGQFVKADGHEGYPDEGTDGGSKATSLNSQI